MHTLIKTSELVVYLIHIRIVFEVFDGVFEVFDCVFEVFDCVYDTFIFRFAYG
jgi:hypothetical protein